jgi:hypothetical protein
MASSPLGQLQVLGICGYRTVRMTDRVAFELVDA